MPRKKKEENEESTAETAVEETETDAAEVKADAAETEEKAEESTSIVDAVTNAVASAVETVAETASSVVSTVAKAVSGNSEEEKKSDRGNRAERVGVVASDKMEKTVTVRVDRLVKHPMYRKYIKRRKKFMAHDELGATIGDKVRIVETRPLSARKRWRVVEIIQKAEK
jgi:small subunit ribosomal protein S17